MTLSDRFGTHDLVATFFAVEVDTASLLRVEVVRENRERAMILVAARARFARTRRVFGYRVRMRQEIGVK